MLGLIKRNFKYLTTESFTLLYKNMVRSQLDYCSSVWSPYRKGDIEALEKVQKKATKILPQFKNLKYEVHLRACKLPTLYFRCIRGDMIETVKIVIGIYDTVVSPNMLQAGSSYATRGHDFRLQKIRARYDLRKYYARQRKRRITWVRPLPTAFKIYVEFSVKLCHLCRTVNCFKNRLDNFWKDQQIIYNFRAEIYGTGNRSEVTV